MKWIGGMIQKLKDKGERMLRESGLIPRGLTSGPFQGTGDVVTANRREPRKGAEQVYGWFTTASKTLLVGRRAADAGPLSTKSYSPSDRCEDLSVENPAYVARLQVQLGHAEKVEADARVFSNKSRTSRKWRNSTWSARKGLTKRRSPIS